MFHGVSGSKRNATDGHRSRFVWLRASCAPATSKVMIQAALLGLRQEREEREKEREGEREERGKKREREKEREREGEESGKRGKRVRRGKRGNQETNDKGKEKREGERRKERERDKSEKREIGRCSVGRGKRLPRFKSLQEKPLSSPASALSE